LIPFVQQFVIPLRVAMHGATVLIGQAVVSRAALVALQLVAWDLVILP